MKKSKISASMMCASFMELEKTIKLFEDENIDYLHIDVMDGHFVPNIGLGVDYMRGLREITHIPLDIHLMIESPEYKFDWLGIHKSDIVTVHYESTPQVQRALDKLKPYGCKCFLAINPATPINVIEEVTDYIDGINLLMVNPGFAGQKMVGSTMKKAEKLQRYLEEINRSDLDVEVDGNITVEKAKQLRETGANIFVAGTSSLFTGDRDNYAENINKLRQVVM